MPAEIFSHCPHCTSSDTRLVSDDAMDFVCEDCGHEWEGEYNHYNREPEIDPDR